MFFRDPGGSPTLPPKKPARQGGQFKKEETHMKRTQNRSPLVRTESTLETEVLG